MQENWLDKIIFSLFQFFKNWWNHIFFYAVIFFRYLAPTVFELSISHTSATNGSNSQVLFITMNVCQLIKKNYKIITVPSLDSSGVSNHWQSDCLFTATANENQNSQLLALFGDTPSNLWIVLTKGQQGRQCFHLMTSHNYWKQAIHHCHIRHWKPSRVGLLSQFLPFCYFQNYRNTGYLLDITFIFGNSTVCNSFFRSTTKKK